MGLSCFIIPIKNTDTYHANAIKDFVNLSPFGYKRFDKNIVPLCLILTLFFYSNMIGRDAMGITIVNVTKNVE